MAAVRLGLAAATLAYEFLFCPRSSWIFALVLGAFALYSLLLLLKEQARTGVFGLLALFADTVYFLVLFNHAPGEALWLPAVTFLYLMMSGSLGYGPREVAIISVICMVFLFVAPGVSPLRATAAVGCAMAILLAVVKSRLTDTVGVLRRETDEAKEAAERAREEERQRIAQDFHDGPLQSFISFQMRLEILRKIIERDPKAGLEDLRQLQHLSKTQVTEIRTFVRSMRPLGLEGATLTASLRRIAEDFQKETGIPVTFLGPDASLPIAPEVTSDIVQIVREALHNIQKHAGATRAGIAMERAGKALEISVDDNGSGFHFSGVYNLDELELLRLGPVSLKQRARSLNAEMQLESRPGRGASIRMRIPI
jgi:signal transduction histidine kinase